MSEEKLTPHSFGSGKDPFQFAERLKLILEHSDEIKNLNDYQIQKLATVSRAMMGACGAGCGGC